MDNKKLILTVGEFRRLSEIRNKIFQGELMLRLWTILGSSNIDFESHMNVLLLDIQHWDISYDSTQARAWDIKRADDVIMGILINYRR